MLVRYKVLAPVFVNGSYVDPRGRDDVFVMGVEGLDGAALKRADMPSPAESQGKAADDKPAASKAS